MKSFILTLFTLSGFFFSLHGQDNSSANYMLIINEDTVYVGMDASTTYKTSSGEQLDIKLTQPTLLTYTDGMVSFKYDRSSGVSTTEVEEGIRQLMVMKASGNGFMVQEYDRLNPSLLTSLMLSELTKEGVSYGYEKEEESFTHTLVSGQTIKGKRATLTYRGDTEVYTVAAFGDDNRGILVATLLLSGDMSTEDKALIETFLNTLEYID